MRHHALTALTAVWLSAALAGCPDEEIIEDPGPDPVEDELCSGTPTLTVEGPNLEYTFARCAELRMQATALGDGEMAATLTRDGDAVLPTITAGAGGATFRGLVLSGSSTLAGDEPARLWRQGYQSWSFAGVVEMEEPEFDDHGVPTADGDGDATDVLHENGWSSWWLGLAGRSDGASVLLGALSATRTRFYVSFTEDEAWAVWGNRGEAIDLAEGETLVLDAVWVGAGADPFQLHVDYATAAADNAGAPTTADPPPVGWATWYQFYEAVTEQDVRDNLALAASLGEGLTPLDVFQIDDGWQVLWGDWTADEGFPSGMDVLAADIAGAGFTPGLWMAPFYVHRDTTTYAENPDWWVRDLDGEEITFTNLGSGDYAIIDATHPGAGPWMAQQVADRVDEGWTYLKLDFLYAGAQEGLRYQDVTGTEAYRRGMELLREAAGDAWVLACGAPLLPTLGFAESYRTGADIAFSAVPDPQPEFLRWQARTTAARSWSNGIWWWNDPDQLMLREPFDDVRARGAVVAQAASGGTWLLGDDLPALPEDKLGWALDPDVTATRGRLPRPVDPLSQVSGLDPGPMGEMVAPDDTVPVRWELGEDHVLLLNMGDSDLEAACPGGDELLTGTTCEDGAPRVLLPGEGEIWKVPDTDRGVR